MDDVERILSEEMPDFGKRGEAIAQPPPVFRR